MDLPSLHVDDYIKIQKGMCESVRNLCKRVNQLLLLQSLYETRTCDPLLEADDSNDICSSPISRNASYSRLRSMEGKYRSMAILYGNRFTLAVFFL